MGSSSHPPPLTTLPNNYVLLILVTVLAPNLFLLTQSIPFIVFHGISDKCSGKGVTSFTELLSNWSGAQGQCVEIGDGGWDSWTMPLLEQIEIACEKVKNMSELADGFNLVGLSQGALIGRGIIEFCDGAPPVKNFISLAGPHAGIASVPFCGSGIVCILVDALIKFAVYSNFVQEHLAPSGYVKIPTDIEEYLEGCKFLPKINNEINSTRNSTYKERFSSLENLVLIMDEQDTVLVPKETSQFGYYPDGSFDTILPAEETTLYTEDWIGLKALNEAGNVTFINVTGGHLEISQSDMQKYIVPYLEEEPSLKQKIEYSPSFQWSSAIRNFFMELLGLNENQPPASYSAVKSALTSTETTTNELKEEELQRTINLFPRRKLFSLFLSFSSARFLPQKVFKGHKRNMILLSWAFVVKVCKMATESHLLLAEFSVLFDK